MAARKPKRLPDPQVVAVSITVECPHGHQVVLTSRDSLSTDGGCYHGPGAHNGRDCFTPWVEATWRCGQCKPVRGLAPYYSTRVS